LGISTAKRNCECRTLGRLACRDFEQALRLDPRLSSPAIEAPGDPVCAGFNTTAAA